MMITGTDYFQTRLSSYKILYYRYLPLNILRFLKGFKINILSEFNHYVIVFTTHPSISTVQQLNIFKKDFLSHF